VNDHVVLRDHSKAALVGCPYTSGFGNGRPHVGTSYTGAHAKGEGTDGAVPDDVPTPRLTVAMSCLSYVST